MATSIAVEIGPWNDYDATPRSDGLANIVTITDSLGTVSKIVVGVVLGLSWPCAKDILVRMWVWTRHLHQESKSSRSAKLPRDRVPLLDEQRSRPAGPEIPDELDITQAAQINSDASESENRSGRGICAGLSNSKNQQRTTISRWPDILLSIFLAAASVLYAFGGGAVGEIPASTSGLSAARECGVWGLKDNADQRIKDNDDLIQASKENRAAQYGRNCYREQAIVSPDQCGFFQSQQIEYTTKKIDCPFDCPDPDHCICANGIYGSAVQLTTGAFSASSLGLNGRTLPLIKRTSTFVPLDIDYGFVEDNSGDQFQFDYYLGSVNASGTLRENTFTMFGTPFDWGIPVYSVSSAYESTPSGQEYDAWQPIPELARPTNTYMTAIFISPCRIIYSGRCDDYIFQANDELLGEGWPPHRYYNQDPRARVLIAIDSMEICWPDENHCFPPDEQYPENGVEYEIVRNALRRSSSFRSIRYRLGSALMATESISDFESRQLDGQQWIIESQALFNTSLARLQFNALDIAVGDRPTRDAAAGFEDAYYDTTSSWAKGQMCGKYKFHLPSGYTNINIAENIGLLAIPFILWILSLEEKWAFDDTKKPRLQGRWMVFDTLLWALILAGIFCFNRFSPAIGCLWRVSRGFLENLRQSL